MNTISALIFALLGLLAGATADHLSLRVADYAVLPLGRRPGEFRFARMRECFAGGARGNEAILRQRFERPTSKVFPSAVIMPWPLTLPAIQFTRIHGTNTPPLISEPQGGKYRLVDWIQASLIHWLCNRYFEYIGCIQRSEPIKVVSKAADHFAPDRRPRAQGRMCGQRQRCNSVHLVGIPIFDGKSFRIDFPLDPQLQG